MVIPLQGHSGYQLKHLLSKLNYILTISNHRLESAGLNALEELLFTMLGMSGEDSNACLVCKGDWINIWKTTLLKA